MNLGQRARMLSSAIFNKKVVIGLLLAAQPVSALQTVAITRGSRDTTEAEERLKALPVAQKALATVGMAGTEGALLVHRLVK